MDASESKYGEDAAWRAFQGMWSDPWRQLTVEGSRVSLLQVGGREARVIDARIDAADDGEYLQIRVASDFEDYGTGSAHSEARRGAAMANAEEGGACDTWRLRFCGHGDTTAAPAAARVMTCPRDRAHVMGLSGSSSHDAARRAGAARGGGEDYSGGWVCDGECGGRFDGDALRFVCSVCSVDVCERCASAGHGRFEERYEPDALQGELVDATGARAAQTLCRVVSPVAAAPAARVEFRDDDGDTIEFHAPADGNRRGALALYVNGSLHEARVRELSWDPAERVLTDGSGTIPLRHAGAAAAHATITELEALVRLHAAGTAWRVRRGSGSGRGSGKGGGRGGWGGTGGGGGGVIPLRRHPPPRMLLASSGRHCFGALPLGPLQDIAAGPSPTTPALPDRALLTEAVVLAMLRHEEGLRTSAAVQQLLDARGAGSGELIYRALQVQLHAPLTHSLTRE